MLRSGNLKQMTHGMPSRIRADFARLLIPFLLWLNAPVSVEAGFIKIWQFKETAAAPVLVVARVISVQKGERMPEGSLPWKAETLAMTAEIQVLRFYPGSPDLVVPDGLKVHFLTYGPSVTMFINGYPPPLPRIESGHVLIFPLQENKNPSSDPWQLIADSGADMTIPARAEIAASDVPPATGRNFLAREMANMFSRGAPRDVSMAAGYLGSQYEDLTAELMPLLDAAIGNDRERWAEVAANLFAAQPTPRPSVADLLATKLQPNDWPGRQSLLLAQAALQKLKASPDTNALLIQTWIAEAPFHAWGSANSLLEYGDNPITTETLRQALRDDLAASSHIAWTLVRNGHQSALPEALARALKVVDRPDTGRSDIEGAAALLRDYGTDEQLKRLASLVRKYQTTNQKFYSLLWQYATESGNPLREARVLAVVLRDHRVVHNEIRYCDLAVGTLDRAGQHFGACGKTMTERDEAVSRALAWLESQRVSN